MKKLPRNVKKLDEEANPWKEKQKVQTPKEGVQE